MKTPFSRYWVLLLPDYNLWHVNRLFIVYRPAFCIKFTELLS
jgi:hypothetical protein